MHCGGMRIAILVLTVTACSLDPQGAAPSPPIHVSTMDGKTLYSESYSDACAFVADISDGPAQQTFDACCTAGCSTVQVYTPDPLYWTNAWDMCQGEIADGSSVIATRTYSLGCKTVLP